MYEPQTNLPKVVRRIAKKKSFNEPETNLVANHSYTPNYVQKKQ